jgi:hypothetical protein
MSRLKTHNEGHLLDRIGWLRAAVLGANDGIVSTASLLVGVAAASVDKGPVLVAGLAGLVAGALSMAAGEYVSVSSQSDTERADVARERAELEADPEGERHELAAIYEPEDLTRQSLCRSPTNSWPRTRWDLICGMSSDCQNSRRHGQYKRHSHQRPRFSPVRRSLCLLRWFFRRGLLSPASSSPRCYC